jgi:hypothetical protein
MLVMSRIASCGDCPLTARNWSGGAADRFCRQSRGGGARGFDSARIDEPGPREGRRISADRGSLADGAACSRPTAGRHVASGAQLHCTGSFISE